MPDRLLAPDPQVMTTCAVPSHLADAAHGLLDRNGIRNRKWSCAATVAGKAPMSCEEAIDDLERFDEVGIYGLAPEVIRANATKEQIDALCVQIAESEWYAWQEVSAIRRIEGRDITDEQAQAIVDDICDSHGRMPDHMLKVAKAHRRQLLERAAAHGEA